MFTALSPCFLLDLVFPATSCDGFNITVTISVRHAIVGNHRREAEPDTGQTRSRCQQAFGGAQGSGPTRWKEVSV